MLVFIKYPSNSDLWSVPIDCFLLHQHSSHCPSAQICIWCYFLHTLNMFRLNIDKLTHPLSVRWVYHWPTYTWLHEKQTTLSFELKFGQVQYDKSDFISFRFVFANKHRHRNKWLKKNLIFQTMWSRRLD